MDIPFTQVSITARVKEKNVRGAMVISDEVNYLSYSLRAVEAISVHCGRRNLHDEDHAMGASD